MPLIAPGPNPTHRLLVLWALIPPLSMSANLSTCEPDHSTRHFVLFPFISVTPHPRYETLQSDSHHFPTCFSQPKDSGWHLNEEQGGRSVPLSVCLSVSSTATPSIPVLQTLSTVFVFGVCGRWPHSCSF